MKFTNPVFMAILMVRVAFALKKTCEPQYRTQTQLNLSDMSLDVPEAKFGDTNAAPKHEKVVFSYYFPLPRANTATTTLDAPALRRAFAASPAVAPVVKTSSISRTRLSASVNPG